MSKNETGLLSIDNGIDSEVVADASLLAKEYYTDYAQYVLEYRALPSVYDGLKPVQRRIIYTACQYPKKLMKTAKLSGLCLAYHPHGSSSITGAINEMASPVNALPLFTTKGNFGGIGFSASADRYTELYLSEIARQNFCQFIDYADYELGEIGEMEPSSLPTLIPYSMIKGSEGIGIGLSTKVMPLNLLGLIDFYIDYIKNDGVINKDKLPLPDVGCSLLEMSKEDLQNSVMQCKGWVTVSSIVTQISEDSFLIEGLYGKSLDSVIKKIDKWYGWFKDEKVGYRDSSTTSIKYVFEIYDNSITPEDFKSAMTYATRKSASFSRVLEEDGNAIYSSFEYSVRKSLDCLNRAIDRKMKSEIERSQKQLDLYTVLEVCKSQGVFDNIIEMTTDQLVNLIVQSSGCDPETAGDIVKKPISYLTRSHQKEKDSLEVLIEELKSHNRKEYLISLYTDLRKAVLPIYEERKHSITQDMVLKNPCIKYISNEDISVTDGDGDPFENSVYFVSDKGYIYKRNISTSSETSLVLSTCDNDEIVGFVTDQFKYIEVITGFNYSGWEGRSYYNIEDIVKDKKFISLRQDDCETIKSVNGVNEIPEGYESALKGSRISSTKFFRL